nr:reverse transcriptase domain-containing protein [Tanacetum cinerariifolium]
MFLIASRFPTPSLAYAFFSLRAIVTSSSKLARDQTSNPTLSMNPTPKVRIRRTSKQKVENSNYEEHLTPVATMTDNRTMAKMLRAPTEGWAARRWLVKEPPRLITTWDDLVLKLINEFFPPSRTTNLRNEISNFQQKFDESFHEAWERYKDLLRACPHHGFTELHQLDTFYNALNPADQDSLNAAAGGNLLEKTQVKAVEEIYVTCGGAHPYYQCLAADGNTFLEFWDSIQGYVSAAAGNYNQGNPGYLPQSVANQLRPPGFAQPNVQNNQNRFGQPQGFNRTNFNQEQPYQATAQSNQNFHLNELEKIKRMNIVRLKAMQNQIDMVKNELRNEMKTSIQTSLSNQTNEIKNMMASLLQMNTASTSRLGSFTSNTVANPKGKLKAITTRSGLVTDGPTIPTLPKSVNLEKDECVEEMYTDPDLTEYTIKRSYLKSYQKLGDPGKFLIPCGFKLANRAICTPDGIASEFFVPVGKFTFPADFVVVDYESDPRVPLILGRPFLRTARALIDFHDEEMILRDEDERLTLNMKHDTTSYSNHPYRESVNLINIFNLSSEDCLKDLVSNKQSGNPTFLLHKEIASSEQKFDESFHEAWERYKDLLRACPHHGFTELHQLDTFYNALDLADQDSLNAAASGNLFEKSPQDALTTIENKSMVRNSRSKPIGSPVNSCDNHSSSEIAKLTHAVNQQTSAVTTVMTDMLKQLQSNPPPTQVKAVEEIYVTCEGADPYYQCLAADGNTFLEFWDSIQGYVSAAAGNYNQGNPGYRPQGVANQLRPPGFAQPNVQNNQNRFGQPQGFNRTNFNQEQPYQATAQSNQNFHLNELEKIKRMNNVRLKAMQNQIDMVKNELRNEMKTSIQTSLSNQTNEIKNMMASLLQMNTASTSGLGSFPSNTVANPKGELKAITTRSGLVTDGPTIPTLPKSVNLEEDECVEEMYTDPDLAEYTIKVPPPPV